ncbi:MAG: ABC transporter ATP-binding protein, partial [Clostridia bacterium]|nr:ABC transporter ATP-binding protein [Clostridia bacterium]
EPTGELDPVSSKQIFEVLARLNKDYGMTIVIVEQKVMLLAEYVKRLIVMEEGKIFRDGPVRTVFAEQKALEDIGVHVPRVISLHGKLSHRYGYSKEVTLTVAEAKRMVEEVLQDVKI